MRYAEVLLMYAECCAQTSDNDGLQYLNMVQQRAGSKTISSSLTLDAVKKEKQYEMWMEGCRFIDLVRWGEAAAKLANNGDSVPRSKINLPQKTAADTKVSLTGQILTSIRVRSTGSKQGSMSIYPFPYSELSINENLVQNPDGSFWF
jgi:hypothetical protein